MTDQSRKERTERTWLSRRLVQPIVGVLQSGLSVEAVAKALALGSTTGLSPLVGTTTVTCSALALLLRLNPVAAVTANYAVYPLQVLMILPFARLGQRITGWQVIPTSPSEIRSLFISEGFGAFQTLGSTMANAALAWLLVTPLLYLASHRFSLILLRRWKQTRERAGS